MSSMLPSTSRSPMETAMIATDSDASTSSTREDRNEIRSTFIVLARYWSPTALMVATWALARLKTLSVGRPATTSRKCPDRTPRVAHCRSTRASVNRPIRTMNTGMIGTVRAMITAASGSWVRMKPVAMSGTTTARTSCGRYRAK